MVPHKIGNNMQTAEGFSLLAESLGIDLSTLQPYQFPKDIHDYPREHS